MAVTCWCRQKFAESQNPQKVVIAKCICFLANFTEPQLTNIQANYWVGQMYCGLPDQNLGWAIAHAT